MKGSKKSLNFIYIIIQCSYWMSGCAVVSFAAVYLSEIGFSKSSIGVICAAGSVAGFLIMTLNSTLIDSNRWALFRLIKSIQSAAVLLNILLIFENDLQLLCAVDYVICIALIQSLPPAYNMLYMNLRFHGEYADFGIARGLGSLTFSCASVAIGLLLGSASAKILPIIVSLLFIPQYLGVEYIGKRLYDNNNSSVSCRKTNFNVKDLALFITSNKWFMLFCIGVSILIAVNRVFSTFLNIICERCGGDTSTVGIVLSYMSFLEIPVILGFTKLRERFHIKQLLAASFLLYTLKALLLTFSHSVPMLFIGASLHGLSFGLLTPASIIYVSEKVSQADAGKSQSLLAALPVLFTGITVIVSGFLLDFIGAFNSFVIMAVISAAGCTIGLISLRMIIKE